MPPVYTQGTHARGWDDSGLPESTREYLQNGASDHRNNHLFDAACQFRDHRYTQAQAEPPLFARARADGLDEEEIQNTIDQAYKRPPREPARGRSSGYSHGTAAHTTSPPPRPQSVPRSLPPPIADGFKVLIEFIFRPGESIVLGKGSYNGKGDLQIDGGIMILRENWLKRIAAKTISEFYSSQLDGLFLKVNPMKDKGRSDKDVAAFRHLLVEFDLDNNGNLIPKELQYAWLIDSQLPISAIIDSGGKSIHALICVDAPDLAEYKRRQEIVWDYFKDCYLDPSNKNPSRYFRCPDVTRNLYGPGHVLIGTASQALLSLKLGADCWDLWEKSRSASTQNTKREDLKRLLQPRSINELSEIAPAQLICGMLYQGGKMSFSGGSKTFKTWNLYHVLFCVANGLPYFGFPTVRTLVLIFDFELIDYDCRYRLKKIADCYNLPGDPFANLRIVPLRGRSIDFADVLTQEVTTEIIRNSGAGAFALDPLYKALGKHDENSNSDIARVLRPFEQLTVDCGVSFVYNQHFSKGNQAAKDPMDRIAGGGTFARDPDAILTFTRHREEGCFTVNVNQRSFDQIKPFVVRWRFPIFGRDNSLDPEDLEPVKKLGRPKDTTADEKIMAALYGAEDAGGLSTARLCAATDYGRTTIWRRTRKLVDKGEAIKSAITKTYQLSARNAGKWAQIPKIDP